MTDASREYTLIVANHRLIRRLETPISPIDDEMLFLDFRPWWLVKQLTVYSALVRHSCAICFNEIFVENLATQHNHLHPPVCITCYERLRTCPFCRTPLRLLSPKWPRLSPALF